MPRAVANWHMKLRATMPSGNGRAPPSDVRKCPRGLEWREIEKRRDLSTEGGAAAERRGDAADTVV